MIRELPAHIVGRAEREIRVAAEWWAANLSRIRYHLYYRLLEDPPRIEVLAMWHTSRGSGPRLP